MSAGFENIIVCKKLLQSEGVRYFIKDDPWFFASTFSIMSVHEILYLMFLLYTAEVRYNMQHPRLHKIRLKALIALREGSLQRFTLYMSCIIKMPMLLPTLSWQVVPLGSLGMPHRSHSIYWVFRVCPPQSPWLPILHWCWLLSDWVWGKRWGQINLLERTNNLVVTEQKWMYSYNKRTELENIWV